MPSLSAIALLEFTDTFLGTVPPDAVEMVLRKSCTYEVAAGRLVFPIPDPAQRVAMVLSGTARSFLTAANGRQLTVRYARRGALIGKYSDLSGDHAPLALQALTDATILEFDIEAFTLGVATQISVSTALNAELARRLEDVYAAVGDSAFGSIRQRIIRQLLALATPETHEHRPSVHISQRQIADAIGSSREVVARQLAQLRSDGFIRTGPRAIELLCIDQLAASLNHWQPATPY